MSQALALQRPLRVLQTGAAQLKLRAQRLWRAYPRETVGFGVLAAATAIALGGAAHSTPELAGAKAAQPPAPPPLLIQQIAPDQALRVNQSIPLAGGPNPAAAPFVFKGDAAARNRALE